MKYIHDTNIEQTRLTAVTIGNFDGLHRGHCRLLDAVRQCAAAERLSSVVFSFYPHPAAVLRGQPMRGILSREEKNSLLDAMGMEVYIEYPFDRDFAGLDPVYFAKGLLFGQLSCRCLFVGENYRFGKNRMGDVNLLRQIGAEVGYEVRSVPLLTEENEKISSSRIRGRITGHDFAEAERLLGRPYYVGGTVVQGKKIGRTIGFPTVNIIPPDEKLLPGNGVYLTKTMHRGKLYGSVTNVGYNPTVGGGGRTVETHLYDYDGDWYGEEIQVFFYRWVRDEMKFENLEQLKKQIDADVTAGKAYQCPDAPR